MPVDVASGKCGQSDHAECRAAKVRRASLISAHGTSSWSCRFSRSGIILVRNVCIMIRQ